MHLLTDLKRWPPARVCLSALLFCQLSSAVPLARGQVRGALNRKYSDTLDLVFNLNQDECRLTRDRVTLRFLPSFQKESQIVICQRLDGETFAFIQNLSQSDGQVWGAVIAGATGGKERTPGEIALRFHVQTRKCEVGSDITKQWMQEVLSLPLNPPPFEGQYMKDGVGYEVVIDAGSNSTRVAVQGPREGVPLISWMNKVKKALDSTSVSARKATE